MALFDKHDILRPDSDLIEWMRQIRRTIHQYPELAYKEHRTKALIVEKLRELGIPCRADIAETGVVATIDSDLSSVKGAEPQSCVALRADMDGLPVEEKTELPFASKIAGQMHACGHDGHVAMLLGAAALLRHQVVPGRVVLLFQPAEESGNGARAMLEGGALEGVRSIFAGHIDLHFEVGQIAAQAGLICANTDKFRIQVCGPGGHAARPHETVDCIVVASHLVMSIQTLVSREINPAYPTVVSIGRIQGGTASNIIAEEVVLEGTVRATDPAIRRQILAGLERMVRATAGMYNAGTAIQIKEGLPPVINDPAAAKLAREAAGLVVGSKGVTAQPHPSLGGEDFACYLAKVPGCLVRFGAGSPGRAIVPAHSPRYDFDEGVLPVGAGYLANVAMLALSREDLRENS
ncbi:MAG: peptidase M20 [Deltaproteobacteria bacterium RIFOXYD12_FULL_57_12]|nr:MAG: peptidase M20 [Deltaproteobacteria bacterium RIFOXYD12_FULL_57_12]